jgi:hypothetical protein
MKGETVEAQKLNPQWSRIEESDLKDVDRLKEKFREEIGKKPGAMGTFTNQGLILRRGREVVGYFVYEMKQRANRESCLLVQQLYINPQERKLETTFKIIGVVCGEAQRQHTNYVGWVPQSDVMLKMTGRSSAEFDPSVEAYVFPVAELMRKSLESNEKQ